MIIRLKKDASQKLAKLVIAKIRSFGLTADVSMGKTGIEIIGVLGDTKAIPLSTFSELEGVEDVIRVSREFKLVSREYHPRTRVIRIGDKKLGEKAPVVIAGPCSVEDEQTTLKIAAAVKKAGADAFRGGAYKPRTSPYSYQGPGKKGLEILDLCRKRTGLPIVTEATGTHRHQCPDNSFEKRTVLENVADYADVVQIGTRNMKSYGLLLEVVNRTRKSKTPILLKRGEAATIKEFLLAAEYMVANGNPNVILCLRGIRTFESTKYQRYTSDIAAIQVLKQESNLPVLFDPSHSTGKRGLVEAVALAAVAAGADGLLIECHTTPANALSDGQECVTPKELAQIIRKAAKVKKIVNEL